MKRALIFMPNKWKTKKRLGLCPRPRRGWGRALSCTLPLHEFNLRPPPLSGILGSAPGMCKIQGSQYKIQGSQATIKKGYASYACILVKMHMYTYISCYISTCSHPKQSGSVSVPICTYMRYIVTRLNCKLLRPRPINYMLTC